MPYVLLLGRILFSAIFVLSGINHFSSQMIGYAQAEGVPLANFLVPASGVLAILGGLSIATGYYARWGAWAIALFLLPVTFMMHDFWNLTGMEAQIQQIMFLKNLSMLGGAFVISYFGSGPKSIRREGDIDVVVYEQHYQVAS